MSGDPRSGPAARIERIVDGAADELVHVIEAGVDFVQATLLGTAGSKGGPIVEPLARRAAIAAAGQFTEAVHSHGRRLEAEPEAMDFAEVGGLRARREGRERER